MNKPLIFTTALISAALVAGAAVDEDNIRNRLFPEVKIVEYRREVRPGDTLVLLSKSSKSLDHMLRKEYTVYCFERLWIGHMLRYHTDGFPESPTTVSLLLC